MAELVVYKGNERIRLTMPSATCYLYRIGSGQIDGEGFIEINDSQRLNKLAEEVRDDYSSWIYSFNKSFVEADIKLDELSLFFLTDLSCKRSEFFETFDHVCSLMLIQEQLAGVELTSARLIGVEASFERAFRSVFPKAVISIENRGRSKITLWRRLGSDGLYLLRTAGVLFANLILCRNKQQRCHLNRVFFSVYPQMFAADGREIKYGDFVDKEDHYLVSILVDGMHQRASITEYVKWCREAISRGFLVIDQHLTLQDFAVGSYWLFRLWWFLFSRRDKAYVFKNIDISDLIQTELLFSVSRVIRLCVLKGGLRRFLDENRIKELVYYPCEYPLGRMISFVAVSADSEILRTGFQMGACSQRRLEQFLAPGEGSTKGSFLYHAPIPDRILAENAAAASIYRYAGYQNIDIMDTVYRSAYLDGITAEKRVGWILIAPGLHDGAMMLENLRGEISDHLDNTYLFKPHPRADNHYLTEWSYINNFRISTQPIETLLAVVSHVYVTYSSVGVEAQRLGVDVTVIDVPGRVNISSLLDRES